MEKNKPSKIIANLFGRQIIAIVHVVMLAEVRGGLAHFRVELDVHDFPFLINDRILRERKHNYSVMKRLDLGNPKGGGGEKTLTKYLPWGESAAGWSSRLHRAGKRRVWCCYRARPPFLHGESCTEIRWRGPRGRRKCASVRAEAEWRDPWAEVDLKGGNKSSPM